MQNVCLVLKWLSHTACVSLESGQVRKALEQMYKQDADACEETQEKKRAEIAAKEQKEKAAKGKKEDEKKKLRVESVAQPQVASLVSSTLLDGAFHVLTVVSQDGNQCNVAPYDPQNDRTERGTPSTCFASIQYLPQVHASSPVAVERYC